MADELPFAVVVDGATDIAKRTNMEQMMTEATGRKPVQRVYLWSTSNKTTNKEYDPLADGPSSAAGPGPILPAKNELIPHDEAKEYLEVGLIFGDEPSKYILTGQSRNKVWITEQKERGVLRRDERAMRVFTPVTDKIVKQSKFYVGCHAEGGRLHPRVIAGKSVFFYAEFWNGVEDGLPAKDRLTQVNRRCRYHAARDKVHEGDQITARIEPAESRENIAANPPIFTKKENLGYSLQLLWPLFEATRETAFLKAMMHCVDEAKRSDQKHGLRGSTDGCAFEFMDLD